MSQRYHLHVRIFNSTKKSVNQVYLPTCQENLQKSIFDQLRGLFCTPPTRVKINVEVSTSFHLLNTTHRWQLFRDPSNWPSNMPEITLTHLFPKTFSRGFILTPQQLVNNE